MNTDLGAAIRRRCRVAVIPVAAIVLLTGYDVMPLVDVHARLTLSSVACLEEKGTLEDGPTGCEVDLDRKPANEWLVPGQDKQRGFGTWLKNVLGITPVVPDLTTAVRWSDDPGRQLRGLRLIRFGAALSHKILPTGECEQLTRLRPDELITLNDGLLCNTHYGQMQFLHAQATQTDDPAAVTRAKIKAWSLFLFEVAAMSDAELRQSYCARFGADRTPFDVAMLPDTASGPCREEWDIASLFTQSCGSIRTSLDCSGTDDPERYAIARMAAVGALLHLIQDSYSQSHCERGDCERGPVARIECQPITRFTTYVGQVGHSAADSEPAITESCTSSDRVTDPITAGARVLYHITNESSSAKFWRDMELVFGTDADAKKMLPASAGECFGGEG